MQFVDGVIEFRDRSSMTVLGRDDIEKQVSSLFQIGFEFPDVGPSNLEPHVASFTHLTYSPQAYTVHCRQMDARSSL